MGVSITPGSVGYEESSGSKEYSQEQIKTAAEREPDMERFFEEFFIKVFGPDELRRSKEIEIQELKAEIGNLTKPHSIGSIGDYLADVRSGQSKIEKLQREIDNMPGTGQSVLEQKLEEDAAAKRQADIALGATSFGAGATRTNELRGQTDNLLAANQLAAEQTRGISDQFIGDVGGTRDIFNTNIDQLLSTLRPTATSAPINLKMGNFETPFFSGTQRYAQGEFGDRNLERSGENTRLLGLMKNTGLDQSALENLLTKEGIGAERGFTDEKFNMKNAIGNLLNQISTSNLPNAAQTELLNFLTGQANLGEKLRFSMPSVNTTGSESTSSSSGGIVSGLPGL